MKSKALQLSLALCAAALLLLVVVLPYAGGYGVRKSILGLLLDRWFSSESTTWQYGALVPFVVGWLVWKQRAVLKALPIAGSLAGLPVMLLAMFSYFIGSKANIYYFGYLAIQMFVAGAIVWVLGWRWMRTLLFPWIVLATTWPLYFLEERLGFPLRLLSTEGVMAIVRVLHLPVIAQGTSLFSASSGADVGSWMTLKVDGPCSGMNTLFALMFVALLYSHHQQPTTWRRALLFTCSIPLALLGNMVRISLLIGGCAVFGQEFAVGSEQNEMSAYHLLSGLVVFVVAFIGLQFVSRFMSRRLGGKRKPRDLHDAPAIASARPSIP